MNRKNIHRKARGGGYVCDCPIGSHRGTDIGFVSSFIGVVVGLAIGANILNTLTVIGDPSTGKTTLSRHIARRLHQ